MDTLKNKKKRKFQNIQIISENAPYAADSYITDKSIANESLFEEDVEQEELSQLTKNYKISDQKYGMS